MWLHRLLKRRSLGSTTKTGLGSYRPNYSENDVFHNLFNISQEITIFIVIHKDYIQSRNTNIIYLLQNLKKKVVILCSSLEAESLKAWPNVKSSKTDDYVLLAIINE